MKIKKLNKKEIKFLFNNGIIKNYNYFKIIFLKNKKYNKISIIIYKKKIKKAFIRNKIKRIIYSSILQNKFLLKKNFYYIIFIYKKTIFNFKLINKNIIKILKNLILNKNE
ncbi:MAG: ribonuclease P protein component [Candidatus Shikimatogenerans sp. JK-2022]|nr:ribonuclease P protein component [Candidatus Shikimatogenerans bostrichidophilus]